MNKIIFATYGTSAALQHARNQLESWGYPVSRDFSQATHILLPVPSGDTWRTLPPLASDRTVFGGYLPKLSCKTVDMLQEEYYLAENAAITAQCALRYAPIQPGMSVLVIGWGRIGKHLAALLENAGAQVSIAVRSLQSHSALLSVGMDAVLLSQLDASRYDVIFNTAPAPVLQQSNCRSDAILIDLASEKGITGDKVIWARGLPGKDAPELSGRLIAKTALRYALGKES